jgi:hypothetical protein
MKFFSGWRATDSRGLRVQSIAASQSFAPAVTIDPRGNDHVPLFETVCLHRRIPDLERLCLLGASAPVLLAV